MSFKDFIEDVPTLPWGSQVKRMGWHWTTFTLAQGCVATGDEHAVWTYIKHTRAYGALIKKASAVDAMAIKRAATEKN